MRWWDSRLIHEPTAPADAVVVKRPPRPSALAAHGEPLFEGASEPPDESERSADERLSIPELTRCHAMVGQSPGRRVDHLSGRRDRYGASTERARRRDESLKSDPRNGIARLGRGLVTKPSTVIENMILK